jgi:hypothetical protein
MDDAVRWWAGREEPRKARPSFARVRARIGSGGIPRRSGLPRADGRRNATAREEGSPPAATRNGGSRIARERTEVFEELASESARAHDKDVHHVVEHRLDVLAGLEPGTRDGTGSKQQAVDVRPPPGEVPAVVHARGHPRSRVRPARAPRGLAQRRQFSVEQFASTKKSVAVVPPSPTSSVFKLGRATHAARHARASRRPWR